jgi:hypothetical protein
VEKGTQQGMLPCAAECPLGLFLVKFPDYLVMPVDP